MRWKMSAGVLVALALLIPAAPAVAQTGPLRLAGACQTVERKVFKDIRELITIDLDTATDVQVRILANQILSVGMTESLTVLPDAVQARLDGTAADLRAFLKADVLDAWTRDLRISVGQTLSGAGANVQAAGQKVLKAPSVDAYLAYLNDGFYAARALDCASQPSATPSVTPSVTPSATTSVTPSASASATNTAVPVPATTSASPATSGDGGGLPVTGSNTGLVAAIGGLLLLLGGAGYLMGRRRRSRFVA